MAKIDQKRFYWIKIKDTFLTSDKVDFLMSQKGGANYVVMYQALCLKAINTNGKLARMLGDIFVPFDPEKIQRDLKWFDIDTVRVGLELLMRLDLIRREADGALAINDFENLIGSETGAAARKRLYRNSSPDNLIAGDNVPQSVPSSPHTPYLKILDTRDKRLEIRDKTKEDKQDKQDKQDKPLDVAERLTDFLIEKEFIDEETDETDVLLINDLFQELLKKYDFKNILLSLRYTINQAKGKIDKPYEYLWQSLHQNCEHFKNTENDYKIKEETSSFLKKTEDTNEDILKVTLNQLQDVLDKKKIEIGKEKKS